MWPERYHEVFCNNCRSYIGKFVARIAKEEWLCGKCVKQYGKNKNEILLDLAVGPKVETVDPVDAGFNIKPEHPDAGIFFTDLDAQDQIWKDVAKPVKLYSFKGEPIIHSKREKGTLIKEN